MKKELAQTLTAAIVQFIDRERPEGTVCCSSYECERLEKAFEVNNLDFVEEFTRRKLSGLTEFEDRLVAFSLQCNGEFDVAREEAAKWSKELIALAKKELLSYHDESNPAIEAMADLERTFECNPDKLPIWLKDELNKAFKKGQEASHEDYIKGYTNGYKDAEERYNEQTSYHFPPITVRPLCWEPGGTCTNPHMDCVNCPRKTTGGGYNTQFGTSTAKAEG